MNELKLTLSHQIEEHRTYVSTLASITRIRDNQWERLLNEKVRCCERASVRDGLRQCVAQCGKPRQRGAVSFDFLSPNSCDNVTANLARKGFPAVYRPRIWYDILEGPAADSLLNSEQASFGESERAEQRCEFKLWRLAA